MRLGNPNGAAALRRGTTQTQSKSPRRARRPFFPGVPLTRTLGEHEALFANRKIREVLGFREEHNWRRYVRP